MYGDEITAREGIERFKQFLHEIGMPTSFAELGAKEEDIEKMAEVACYGDGRDGYVYGFVNLNKNYDSIPNGVKTLSM